MTFPLSGVQRFNLDKEVKRKQLVDHNHQLEKDKKKRSSLEHRQQAVQSREKAEAE